MKLLTISIAAYNAEKYLEKCLSSIFKAERAKQYCDVIIVNDGSTDSTWEIAESYYARYPESIQLVYQKNAGYGSTVNESIKRAQGKYFRLLDADDWVVSKNLDNLLEDLASVESDCIISPYFQYVEDERSVISVDDICKTNFGNLSEINFTRKQITMHSLIFRTDILKNTIKLDTRILYTDTEFVVQAMSVSKTFFLYDFPIYCYRLGREGQSCDYKQVAKHLNDLAVVIKSVSDVYRNVQIRFQKEFISRQLLGAYGQYFNALFASHNFSYSFFREKYDYFRSINKEVWISFVKRRPDVFLAKKMGPIGYWTISNLRTAFINRG